MRSYSQPSTTLSASLNRARRHARHILPAPVWHTVAGMLGWTHRLAWRIRRAARATYCPALLPWFAFNYRSTGSDRLHYLALRWHPGRSKTIMALFAVLWPFVSTMQALRMTRRFAPYVTRHYRISAGRQLVDQIVLANRHNIAPDAYYKFKLFRPENRARVRHFVQHHEICVLLPELNRQVNTTVLGDKLQFFENATRHALPTPEVVVAFDQGAVLRWYAEPTGQLPRTDLVFKPSTIYCGTGVQLWRYLPETEQWICNQQRLNATDLVREFCALARDNRYIVQRCLSNHRDIRPLAGEGICTVRVVTYRRHGAASLLLACLRMPTGSSFVDNFTAGGIAAPVHPVEGTLGPAVGKDIRSGVLEFHPNSAAPITGRRLPHWQNTIELARAAHACFPEYAFIGWDIIITDTGPVLLEANLTWGVELCQMSHDMPLGETVFPEVFLEHVALRHNLRSL